MPNSDTAQSPAPLWDKLPDSELEARKKELSPSQFRITQQGGTEPPFRNDYWDHHRSGIYVDVVSGEPLFSSKDKYDSGSGWPSFTRPLEPDRLVRKTDSSLGEERVELRSRRADSHLGHVFEDGPPPTGQRYCINSGALRFIPAERLAAEGYPDYARLFPEVQQTQDRTVEEFSADAKKAAELNRSGVAPEHDVAVLAGGCFWGLEELLRKIDGVIATDAGYAGGSRDTATYEQVKKGTTGHAESVKIVFDPKKLPYERLLAWFFRIHDPTTRDRQGNDVGSQYRSVIFCQSPTQFETAQALKRKLDDLHVLPRSVVTQIVPAQPFYRAEEFHQDYLQKYPDGYSCHFVRPYEL